ncbi:tRNA methyltransferase, has a role in tRNA modification [Tulasnella sp. 427]|nr:tRNA methyltransferase, has a role in tRNA modification [Tulasnella sp. 427]
MPKPALKAFPSTLELTPEEQEAQYVHQVYDKIAPHFSQTRYKPWPLISKFLSSIAPGSIGIDSGTGNGKYLPLDNGGSIFTVGLDRSVNLLKLARFDGKQQEARSGALEQGKEREVVLGDALDVPWRAGAFDYAISIATIHHLVTHDRRKKAVQSLIRAVNPNHGRIMIYVWAVEQDDLSKRVLPSTDHAVADSKEGGKDVLVPWVLTESQRAKNGTSTSLPSSESNAEQREDAKVFDRYYHFFQSWELKALAIEAAREMGLHVGPSEPTLSKSIPQGMEIVQDGWERSNLYVELKLWTRSVPSS